MNGGKGETTRAVNVDFWRLVGSVMIMMFHALGLATENDVCHFSKGYIFVEFFFLLTGYYTAKHFYCGLPPEEYDSAKTSDTGKNEWESIKYSFKKMLKIYPYVFAVIIFVQCLYWVISGIGGIKYFLTDIENVLKSSLLITSGIKEAEMLPVHLWYLSAMMMVMPLVCMLLLSKIRVCYTYYLSWLSFVLLYGTAGFEERGPWPNDLLRAFVCISAGTFVYAISIKIKEKIKNRTEMTTATVLEIVCMTAAPILCFFNSRNLWLIVILFLIGLIFMLSGKTYTSQWRCRGLNWMGEFSLYLFLCHWPMMLLLDQIGYHGNTGWRRTLAVYIILSLAASLLMYAAAQLYKRLAKKENA